MSRKIHHLGMTMTREQHEQWHKGESSLTPEQHDAFMKRLGVTKAQDEEWHRTHSTLEEQRARRNQGISPFAIGGAFVDWCIRLGGIVSKGKQYLVTAEGRRELKNRFEILI